MFLGKSLRILEFSGSDQIIEEDKTNTLIVVRVDLEKKPKLLDRILSLTQVRLYNAQTMVRSEEGTMLKIPPFDQILLLAKLYVSSAF